MKYQYKKATRKQVEATLKYYTNLNRLAEVSGEVLPSPLSRSKKNQFKAKKNRYEKDRFKTI